MTFLKKILPLLIVAIVFAIGGYFVGSGMNTEQGAALYTGVKAVPSAVKTVTVAPTPAGLTHLVYSNGACNIFKWNATNNSWFQIGTVGVNERNCHDFPVASTDLSAQIIATAGVTVLPGISKGDVAIPAGVINMGWIDGIGCNIFRWDDNKKAWESLGVANGVTKENCMAIAVHPEVPTPVAKPTKPTVPTTKATTTTKTQ